MSALAKLKQDIADKTHGVSSQIENDTFWELMNAATKDNKMLQESIDTEDTNKNPVTRKEWVQKFNNIIDFDPDAIDEQFFKFSQNDTAEEKATIREKLQKQLLGTWFRFNHEKYTFKPAEWKKINVDKLDDVGKPITITDQVGKLKICKDLLNAVESYSAGSTTLFNTPIYACIAFIKGKSSATKKLAYSTHMSALMFLKGKVYSIGLGQESTKPRDPNAKINKNNLRSQARIFTPEPMIKEKHSFAIIDMGILNQTHLNKIQEVISSSPIICHTEAIYDKIDLDHAKNHKGIEFGEFYLKPAINYCRFAGHTSRIISALKSKRAPMNCASFLETVFGIKCNFGIIGPSNPNWCRRKPGKYPSKFTIEQLDRIVSAFKTNDINKFKRALENSKSPNAEVPRQTYTRKTSKDVEVEKMPTPTPTPTPPAPTAAKSRKRKASASAGAGSNQTNRTKRRLAR